MNRTERQRTRRARVVEMVAEGCTNDAIARALNCSVGTVTSDKRQLGLSKVYKKGGSDKARHKREKAAAKRRAEVRDRRRFIETPVPTGQTRVIAPPGLQAAGRTMFPDKVRAVPERFTEPVLKDGANNVKIGGGVLVGDLKGATILTLTLEERATCPRACAIWGACYGNAMPHSTRWRAGAQLERAIKDDLAHACDTYEHVLVRLHILGDFYSVKYVGTWFAMLTAHENLTVFGFTAWGRESPIGQAIERVRARFGRRFQIRYSGVSGRMGAFTIPFPTDRKKIGDAVVCPEQLHAIDRPERGTHCGTCAVCWQTDHPIAFIEH